VVYHPPAWRHRSHPPAPPARAQEYIFSFSYGEDGMVELNLTAGAAGAKKRSEQFQVRASRC
jgi:hypothetical protein